MKKGILLLLTIFIVQLAGAQSVKIKKGVILVDGTEYMVAGESLNRETPVIVSSMADIPILTFQIERGTKWNSDLGKDMPDNSFIVKFIDVDAYMTTKLLPKKLFGKMYKYEVLNEDGTVNEENVLKFVKLYHQDLPVKIKLEY